MAAKQIDREFEETCRILQQTYKILWILNGFLRLEEINVMESAGSII